MISQILYALSSGLRGLLQHPRMLFVVVLVGIFPVMLLLLAQQFLSVGTENFETLQRSRIGAIHDTATHIVSAHANDTSRLQQEIEIVAGDNLDITKFRIATLAKDELIVIAALERDELGVVSTESEVEAYQRAFLEAGTPITFEFNREDVLHWQTFSSHRVNSETWFIFTEQSFTSFQSVVAKRELTAYTMLALTYLFLFGLAYWLIRDIDYRAKFNTAKQQLAERDRFANMIAHELRTPLTAVRGYASLIEESTDTRDEVKQHAARIRESADRQVRLVSDFLEVARLQAGTFTVDRTNVKLRELIERVTDELTQLATEKGLTLTFKKPVREMLIISDATRLEQVFRNVISNAVKYTKDGRVTITLDELTDAIEVRVKDTGTGISAENQKRMFAPFFRVKKKETEKITGTGLGMWITKRLVERLGGTIGLESIRDVGTNVVITLPKK